MKTAGQHNAGSCYVFRDVIEQRILINVFSREWMDEKNDEKSPFSLSINQNIMLCYKRII